MALSKAAIVKLHPVLLVAIIMAVVLVFVLVLLAVQQGTTPEETSYTVRTVRAGTATPKPVSLDADKDGWLNVDDPKPNSHSNPDNDALANHLDPDDDNDGILDAKDKYPLDQNNNGTPDAAERRQKGERYDGDGDGRPDLAELKNVAAAEAEKLGLKLSTSLFHLADFPRQVFRALPDGWNFVCQDADNDGNPDATDRFDRSFGGSYAAYTHDGKWEGHYADIASEAKKYGFIHGSAGTPGSEPPRYEVPSGWSGYVPGSGATSGGSSDSYASFYGHIPSAEQHQYYQATSSPPPTGSYGTPGDSSGYPTPTSGSYYTPSGSDGGHYGSGGSVPPPPPPSGESAPPPPPPPPPPDSGGTH